MPPLAETYHATTAGPSLRTAAVATAASRFTALHSGKSSLPRELLPEIAAAPAPDGSSGGVFAKLRPQVRPQVHIARYELAPAFSKVASHA